MTFIFRNRTIFWDISKWNIRQKKSGTERVVIYAFREYINYLFWESFMENWKIVKTVNFFFLFHKFFKNNLLVYALKVHFNKTDSIFINSL